MDLHLKLLEKNAKRSKEKKKEKREELPRGRRVFCSHVVPKHFKSLKQKRMEPPVTDYTNWTLFNSRLGRNAKVKA